MPKGSGTLLPLGAVFAALYGAYGLQSPFLAPFLNSRGASPLEVGAILAAATVTRIVAGPVAGYLADRWSARRATLVLGAAATGAISFGYLAAQGPRALLLVVLPQAIAVAALAPVADAVGVAAAKAAGFPYGWLRGAGSAAFVAGTLAAGQLVAGQGLGAAMALGGALFLLMAVVALALPRTEAAASAPIVAEDAKRLLTDPGFLRLLVVAALITGSHAVNEAFGVIRWSAAGLSPQVSAALWSVAVGAEVLVFFLIGPPLLDRLGPARALGLVAVAGGIRWALMASTTAIPVLLLAQSLHGLTFAFMHLAAMRVIAETVPDDIAATAQTLYGPFALGLANAALTLAAGHLYGWYGAGAYWPMVALCGFAGMLALGIRTRAAEGSRERSGG